MSGTACPGCGVRLPPRSGPTHAYIGASAACWALYGELLAREFQDASLLDVHKLTVDAYAVQHPGKPERRAIQSVGIHLATLSLVLEHGADPREGPKLHRRLVRRPELTWLEPPRPNGTLTVADVLAADDHRAAVRAWARDVWDAWSAHHATVESWLAHALD
jgi:hypothetical protein